MTTQIRKNIPMNTRKRLSQYCSQFKVSLDVLYKSTTGAIYKFSS